MYFPFFRSTYGKRVTYNKYIKYSAIYRSMWGHDATIRVFKLIRNIYREEIFLCTRKIFNLFIL